MAHTIRLGDGLEASLSRGNTRVYTDWILHLSRGPDSAKWTIAAWCGSFYPRLSAGDPPSEIAALVRDAIARAGERYALEPSWRDRPAALLLEELAGDCEGAPQTPVFGAT